MAAVASEGPSPATQRVFKRRKYSIHTNTAFPLPLYVPIIMQLSVSFVIALMALGNLVLSMPVHRMLHELTRS
jgi:hypothetical protein